MGWTSSITDYCEGNAIAAAAADAAAAAFPESSRAFLSALNLPTVHPFCAHGNPDADYDVVEAAFGATPNDVVVPPPPMGALEHRFEDESAWEQWVTMWFMAAPPLLAMAELWLRLFAGLMAHLGCIYLLLRLFLGLRQPPQNDESPPSSSSSSSVNRRQRRQRRRRLGGICLMTVASSVVLMTDTYYVLNNGPVAGVLIFLLSLSLAFYTTVRDQLSSVVAVGLWMLVLLAIHLVWDPTNHPNDAGLQFGSSTERVQIPEGLYYFDKNEFIQSVVDHWPEHYRTYSWATTSAAIGSTISSTTGSTTTVVGATPWMPTGDSRTGLPFLIHHWPEPNWHRVFLRTLNENDDESEEEYIALDIAFPPGNTTTTTTKGFQKSQPVYMILHGLNGGSAEEYIRDFTFRRLEEGCTVVVVIARGLMDLPIRGWNIFHGARTIDAHAAALALQRVLRPQDQVHDEDEEEGVLIGVGYSMGAIILSNYVASYGPDCALDGAISLSGGLDMRFQENFERAKRLWQPMLAETLRSDFMLGKWGKRVQARLSKDEMLRMMRATHITEIDRYAVVPYNGFRDLRHYYSSMSALGDIPLNADGLPQEENSGKIHSVSIPLCVVHAFDDPLVTWRATAHNQGFMHPENLVKTGNGNVMLLLTKAGGHVGWPLGVLPMMHKWRWMSDVAMSFGQAVASAKRLKTKHQNERPRRTLLPRTIDEDEALAKEEAAASGDATTTTTVTSEANSEL